MFIVFGKDFLSRSFEARIMNRDLKIHDFLTGSGRLAFRGHQMLMDRL